MTVCPANTQISRGIRPVWSESSLCTQWVAKDPSFLHADSEDWSDWVDAQADLSLRKAHMPFYWFCRYISTEYGYHTNEEGHFEPGDECLMGLRYRVKQKLDTKGHSAVLVLAEVTCSDQWCFFVMPLSKFEEVEVRGRHIGLGLSIRLSVHYACIRSRTVRDRILKFYT